MPGAPLSFGCLLSSPSAPKQPLYLRHTEDLDVWVVCWITEFITRFALLLHITHCYFLPKRSCYNFLAGSTLHQSTLAHLCWYVILARQKKFQRIIPEHLIPFWKSPCGALQSDSASPSSPCFTPWWGITFCLDSRLFSSRCAKVTDLHFSGWWQQRAHQLLRTAAVCTLHCSDLNVPRGPQGKCASEYLRLCCTICCLISTLWYTGFPRRFLNAALLLDILWRLHCSQLTGEVAEQSHLKINTAHPWWGEEEESKQRCAGSVTGGIRQPLVFQRHWQPPLARLQMLPGPSSCVYTV